MLRPYFLIFMSTYNTGYAFFHCLFSCLHIIQVTSGFHVGFGEVYQCYYCQNLFVDSHGHMQSRLPVVFMLGW